MKKLVFKLISVILSFVLLFFLLSGFVALEDAHANDMDLIELEEWEILQNHPYNANEAIFNALPHDDAGNAIYPDDYAGSWIEGNRFVISLTNIDKENQSKYLELAGEYYGCIIFKKAKHSYAKLYEASDKIASILQNEGYEITRWGVSDFENCIVIGVADKTQSGIISFLNDLSNDYSVDVRLESTGSISLCTTYLHGGDNLYNFNTGNNFTLSCCGTYINNQAVLSCGHDIQAVNDIIKNNSAGNIIGTVLYHRFTNNQYGDFEVISLDSSYYGTTNSIASTSYSITGTVSDPALYEFLRYYSKTAGLYFGTVYLKNQTVPTGGKTIKGITIIRSVSGVLNPGDSGGPVFRSDGDGAKYCGVISSTSVTEEYRYIYFTPYKYPNNVGFVAKQS